jgi:hypothetical protein
VSLDRHIGGLGSAIAAACCGLARRAATETFRAGTYDALADAVDHAELTELLAQPARQAVARP